MSVDALARFAASPDGSIWSRTHERFGLDPAAGIEDDVIAHSFRVALLYASDKRDEDAPDDRPGIVTDLADVMRRMR